LVWALAYIWEEEAPVVAAVFALGPRWLKEIEPGRLVKATARNIFCGS